MNDSTATLPPDRDVELQSPFDFRQTVARLEVAMADAGLTVFARIDHAAGALAAGLTMPPTLVLIYGNARGGTPLMIDKPAIALDLPLRVLIREDSAGKVIVAFHPISAILRDAGIPEALATRLDPAQQLLRKALLP